MIQGNDDINRVVQHLENRFILGGDGHIEAEELEDQEVVSERICDRLDDWIASVLLGLENYGWTVRREPNSETLYFARLFPKT